MGNSRNSADASTARMWKALTVGSFCVRRSASGCEKRIVILTASGYDEVKLMLTGVEARDYHFAQIVWT
ncbi:hypothetical protein EBH_0053910 [Eimeria brunetti]|uniref:Uncharacterized protein n=1 Tax=Eimeria brunetti TaxID=51314 RepID=U6LWN1_9EIME|nr:hypothetical protein EBH_0053910 [Eimeria brunetti]